MYHIHLDKDNSRPIYLQIRDWLIASMEQGFFKTGQKIPSARELSERLGVSRMTVLQALRELTLQGRLFTVVGKGTFVGRVEKVEPNLRTVWGFSDTFRAQGFQTGSQVIVFDVIPADVNTARRLEVPEEKPLYRLVRKRLLNNQPVGIESAYLVKSKFPKLEEFDWNTESLYTVLREKYGYDPVCGSNYIEAAAADERTAQLLSIPVNTPVLATERITCLTNSQPIELVRSFYRSDRMRMKVEITPDNPINLLSSKMEQ